MMNKLSLADKAGIIGVGRFLRAFSKLLFALILIRLISKFEFGTYRQVFLLYNLFSVIFFLGIPTSIYYFIPQLDKQKIKIFVVQSEIVLFFLGLILGSLFLIFANYIGNSFTNIALPKYLRLFALFPLLDFPIQTLPPILICLNKHRMAAIVNVTFALTFLLSLLIPLLLGHSLFIAFLCLIIVSAIQFCIVVIYIIRLVGGFPELYNFSILKNQLKYSIPLGLSSFATVISRELDKFIISFFFLPQVFAVYAIGARELPFVTIIPYAVSSTLFPKFVALYKNGNINELLSIWHKAIIKVSLILLPLFSLFFITANEVISILYTDNYIESVPVFRFYLFLLLIHITAFDSFVLSLGFPKFVLYSSLIAIVLNTILNIILIKFVGFVGPAIATMLVSFLVTYYLIRTIILKTKTKWSVVFPWKKYCYILSISIVCGLLTWPLKSINVIPIPKFIIISISFFIIYLILLKIFKIINNDDLEFIKRWITLKVFLK